MGDTVTSGPSYRAPMGEAFEVLAEGLAPFVDRKMAAYFPEDEWILAAAEKLGKRADFLVTVSDPQFQLDVLNRFWGPVFARDLDPGLRGVIGELRTARNAWAHIDEDNPIDLDYALRVNHLVQELLAGVGADGAERLSELSDELRWASVRRDSADLGVSEADALITQLAELQAERAELQERLDEAKQEAASATGRQRAVARQLAELQTQYAAVADLRSRYVTLQRQFHELAASSGDEGRDTLTLADHARAHADEDTDEALAGLTDESAELRRKLAEARRSLEEVNPAETLEGQRWMWLIAGLLVSLSIVIMLVATGV
ncbi:MAG TPA: Swt1 family HEPN domain-containing protein [Acidimicrobiales bacterium]|nr:Swt1 family HEPN domain-containing protein [Acidimicrobiales bacterium]